MALTCTHSTWEAKAGGLLHSEFQNSLGYRQRPYLKINQQDLTLLVLPTSVTAASQASPKHYILFGLTLFTMWDHPHSPCLPNHSYSLWHSFAPWFHVVQNSLM